MGRPRDADIQAIAEHLRRADLLDPAELRELIPSLLLLECVAVRESPPLDREAIAALRDANRRMRAAAGDATAAAQADDDFHRLLTAGCENAQLLEVVDLVRKALLGYERLYMLSPERLAASVEEHEAIVAALEAGDNVLAADRVRENFTRGLPGLQAPIQEGIDSVLRERDAPAPPDETGERCPECAGSGERDGRQCPACEGTGHVMRGLGGG